MAQHIDRDLDSIKSRFRSLLIKYKIKDYKSGWYYLYKLLPEPESRKELTSIVGDYLEFLFPNEKLTLLVPDLAVSSYNLVPLAFLAANIRGHQVAIWAEIGNIADETPILYKDPLENNLTCVFLHDVVSSGYTLRKSVPELKKARWKVRAYVTLIQARPASNQLDENLSYFQSESDVFSGDFQYHYLVDTAEITETHG